MPTTAKTTKKRKTETKRTGRKTSTKKSTTRKRATAKAKTDTTDTLIEARTEIPELPIEQDERKQKKIDEISDRILEIEDIPVSIEPPYIPPPPGDYGITRKVLARIASIAAGEVKGLVPPKRGPLYKFIDTINGRTDGIKVEIGATEAAVDMLIRVQYGSHIPELTSRLRETIATRIHEMTGLNVVEINVRVQDVTPSTPTKQ
jgi:uncharacterized alkaline shock family protein YloU